MGGVIAYGKKEPVHLFFLAFPFVFCDLIMSCHHTAMCAMCIVCL